MEKYRIVEVKFPELTTNDLWIIDFIPEIYYRYEYHVECCEEEFFGLIKRWHKIKYCSSLKQAERQIEFQRERETCKVIKEY
jgi:hypothetical protein